MTGQPLSSTGDGDLRFDVMALDGRLLDTFTLDEVGSWRAAGCFAYLAAKTDRNRLARDDSTEEMSA